ncbi:MAG TPA: hypothetical protein ENI29_14185 [bacterium]|nr:hypothetical protein [bacterium]
MSEEEFDKNRLYDEFINSVDKIGYFSHFFSSIKGSEFETELMKTKYSLIEAKFTNVLNALTKIDDIEYKTKLFINLIYSIKETRLMKEKFSTILDILNKLDNDYVKRNAFESLVDTIEGTSLLEDNLWELFFSLDSKIEVYEKMHAYSVVKDMVQAKLKKENRKTNKIFQFGRESSLYAYNEIKKLIGRNEEIKRLEANFEHILKKPENFSVSSLLIGKGSIGKTLVGRYFVRDLRRKAVEKNIRLNMEYFDCIHFRSKSKIIRELIAKYVQLSWNRGYHLNQTLLYSTLKRENRFILLILDEIHLLKPAEILAFLDIGKQHPNISTLMICRTQDWLRIKKDKLQFDEIIELRQYTFNEICNVLKYRSEIAFQKNVITDELLKIISHIVVDNENMRNGLEILRNCGSLCVKKNLDHITPDIVKETNKDIYPNFRNDLIIELRSNHHELLILFGVARSIENQGNNYTLIDDAYGEYQKICEEYQKICDDNQKMYPESYCNPTIKPVVKTLFKKHIHILTLLKMIVSKTVRNEKPPNGRHLEISLLDISETTLLVLVKDVLDKIFIPYFD